MANLTLIPGGNLDANHTTGVPIVTGMPDSTLSVHIHRYLTQRRVRREIVGATATRHRHCLARLAKIFGQRPTRNLSAHDIERWLASRSHIEQSTLRLEYSIVRGFMRWLVQERVIQRDPMASMKAPKIPRSVPRALEHDDAVRLWNVLPDQRARVIVLLMLDCGLRRIEVARLQLGDWDRLAAQLLVTGKGGHERLVPLPGNVTDKLNRYTADIRSSTGPLIRSQTNPSAGICAEYIGNMMRQWMRSAGVKAAAFDGRGCHSLRHTCASDIAEVEPDLRVVQELLGHEHLSSTEIYLRRLGVARVRAAMDARRTARRGQANAA